MLRSSNAEMDWKFALERVGPERLQWSYAWKVRSQGCFEPAQRLLVLAERLPMLAQRLTSASWKTLLERGVRCSGGSDSPVETADVRLGLHTAVKVRRNIHLWSSVDPTLPSPLSCYGPLI